MVVATPSSDDDGVETFVWKERDSGSDQPFWTISHRKASRIYDSDPHSLKIPRSHNAWKNELKLTRFANQELPEALWGDNFLDLQYGTVHTHGNHRDKNKNVQKNHHQRGVRISFCALEALRTWALMDMDIERRENNQKNVSSTPSDNDMKKDSTNAGKENKLPTIIPHKSGRTPDRWDYTYTTNYSGSVKCVSHFDNFISNGSLDTNQLDQTSLYGVKIFLPQESSTSGASESAAAPFGLASNRLSEDARAIDGNGNYPRPTPELRPPICKCVGGRMICAGVAQTITTGKSFRKAPNQFTKLHFAKISSPSATTSSAKTELPQPRPSPKWVPYNRETDGPFDMESLLNSQTSAPLHYTGTIPFWIQNLDPQSYSFLTTTAVVCGGKGKVDGGFLAVLLRCFVRVNGVRVRLIDTKFVIRRDRKSSDENRSDGKNRRQSPMVVLRERSWQEGSWEKYTSGLKGATGGGFHFLGTDLEQGRRASKTLPHKFPPIVDKLVLYDDAEDQQTRDGFYNLSYRNNNDNRQSDELLTTQNPCEQTVKEEVLRVPALEGSSISNCASGAGILVVVTEEKRLLTIDSRTDRALWEYSLAPSTVLSLAVHPCQDSSPSDPGNVKVVIGNDRGYVQIIEWNGDDKTTENEKGSISKQQFAFDGSDDGKEGKNNVQRPSNWVEKVVWSSNGQYFAAAAGKKIMINGKVLEMEGSVYELDFLPQSQPDAINTGDSKTWETRNDLIPTGQSLIVALYCGLTIVDAKTLTISHRRFDVGSSAVLSFAVSPVDQSIGIGCLDKRLRLFEVAGTANANGGDDHDLKDTNASANFGSFDVRDWIGFDSGVTHVAFSPDNQRLVALGGSILLVINRKSEWGEAPTICLTNQEHEEENRRGKKSRFRAVAWSTKDVLVASTDRFIYVFDVGATIDTIPKRSYPLASKSIEKGFLATDINGEIITWGRSGIRKIKILDKV